ncbi:B12-binding domain-containing radical SAM protein [Actinomadura madurae]|uniref:B12-binding domain-containing radical SAM protein n=1 Tax=Actinomadura madurae TaxID=1993 RepID=UPI002026500F|nr:radical SAM protein [Actinomadura madurae]URN09428.1 B12-binding domain-containing radical SAM protein [Actinomadura madurae]
MSDLVLINSPIHDYSRYPRYTSSYSTPVGLLYVATAAKGAGFDVSILDAEEKQLTPAEIASEIDRRKPRVAGFNAFSMNFPIVEDITERIPGPVTVIAGGPHVSTMPPGHFAKRLGRARILVRHDGEQKIVDILKGVHPLTIPGIHFRDAIGSIVTTAQDAPLDLDALPIPDRTLLATEPYLRDGRRWMDMSISRGCVFACTFCAGSCRSNGTSYRRRSLGSVRREVHHLRERHGVEGIQIVDDLPFDGRASLEAFLDFLERDEITLQWEVSFPLQFLRRLPGETIARAAAAGVARLSFGIESGSFDMRRAVGKLSKEPELYEVVGTLTRNRIASKGYFIIGFPGESKAEMESTIDLARGLHAAGRLGAEHLFRPRVFMFKPMPGSALWTRLRAEGRTEREMLDYSDFEVDKEYFRKHAWGAATRYSLVDAAEIHQMINRFYSEIGEPAP